MKIPSTSPRSKLRGLMAGALMSGAIAWTAPALAQDDGGDEAAAESAEDVEGQAPAAAPEGERATGKKPPGASGETPPQLSEIHNVSKGDTLWDLCTKYLNSPWYWPKIWSYNPQITNPHWIYPGNELRFYPSDENLPTAVEVSRMINAPEGEDEGAQRADRSVVTSSRDIRTGRIGRNSILQSRVAFVDAEEHGNAGVIEHSPKESYLVSSFDKVYVRAKEGAKPGDRFAVYRTQKEIEHPVTGEPFGYVIELLGSLRIEATGSEYATAVIENSYGPIERGDWVGGAPEFMGQRVEPAANSGTAKGYIVETMENGIATIAEHHVIFIDRGRAHGVKAGNVMTIMHRGDGFTKDEEGLPYEDVGEALVIDARENVATAMVIKSVLELSVGDKVEFRSGG